RGGTAPAHRALRSDRARPPLRTSPRGATGIVVRLVSREAWSAHAPPTPGAPCRIPPPSSANRASGASARERSCRGAAVLHLARSHAARRATVRAPARPVG